jgi:hypothetical protein
MIVKSFSQYGCHQRYATAECLMAARYATSTLRMHCVVSAMRLPMLAARVSLERCGQGTNTHSGLVILHDAFMHIYIGFYTCTQIRTYKSNNIDGPDDTRAHTYTYQIPGLASLQLCSVEQFFEVVKRADMARIAALEMLSGAGPGSGGLNGYKAHKFVTLYVRKVEGDKVSGTCELYVYVCMYARCPRRLVFLEVTLWPFACSGCCKNMK